MEAQPEFELSIASQAKPAPFSPLAVATFINSTSDGEAPIAIVSKPVKSFDEKQPGSTANLVRNKDRVNYTDNHLICKTLAQAFPSAKLWTLDLSDNLESTIMAKMDDLFSPDKETMMAALNQIHTQMVFCMHPLGHSMTVGDLMLWGAIRSNHALYAAVESTEKHPEIRTWYYGFMQTQPFVLKVDDAIRAMTKEHPKSKAPVPKNVGFKLEGAEMGKVVVRFPPEPSGYLHIGHAKAAILNATAAKDYEGKFIVRFDDTNPSKEKVEFENAQLKDLHTLGCIPDVVSHTSDYFDQIEQKCVELIEMGKAYCDDTPMETMRKERMDGIASASRDRLVKDNLRIFNEMRAYSEEGRRHCVRAKISVDNKNKALRDPVIYRCNPVPHHRTGTKYKIYPIYDFACPVVDSLEGVTHALRTTEYKDRDAQYLWMLKALGMRSVKVISFSRLNFVRTVLSKRKLQWFVDNKLVSGWDDPRFPTVQGVVRRGCMIEALRKFIISQGPSKNINNLEWASFWAENKKTIDPIAKRFTCVTDQKRVVVTLIGDKDVPKSPEAKEVACHKKNPDLGTKHVYYDSQIFIEQEDAVTFKEGEEITLMDWGNAIIREIAKDADGAITSIKAQLHLDGDFKKTEKKITWIANVEDSLTPCILTTFDHLITKDKLEEDDKIEDFVNPHTIESVKAHGDVNLRTLPVGSIIQFERKGYYRLDRAYDMKTGEAGEFFNIPDGKTVNRYGAKESVKA